MNGALRDPAPGIRMDRSALPSPAAAADLLAGRIRELTDVLIGQAPTTQSGTELRFRSRGSLQVWISGNRRGKWKDHEEGAFGDALALVAHLRRSSMREAYGWSLDWLAIRRCSRTDALPQQLSRQERDRLSTPRPNTSNADFALRVWREGVTALGTPVEAYLTHRGLILPDIAPIRFHAACPRGRDERLPAMLALMTDPLSGEPCGVHRTFLASDGRGKAGGQAKMMLGRAGVIRLVPDEEVTLGLGIAEGIETSLAIMQEFEWSPVWAATSAGGITVFPVLCGVQAITVFADADDGGIGIKAGKACMTRWADAGRGARIIAAPPSHDFADLVASAG
jgi:hypothetical protein